MPDFRHRSEAIEIMDDLNCSGAVVNQTLREIETINRLLGGNYVTIDGIRRLIDKKTTGTIRIADLGCGGGDILRLIREWGSQKNLALELTGYDANPFIISDAENHTAAVCRIRYKAVNIFSEEFEKEKFEIATGTLFFHHFSDNELALFFSQLKRQATMGIVINDIHRHWFAYYSIRWLTALFSRSSMVKFDAPLSVLRAFRKKELVQILKNAGIAKYTIRWMWAFRWQIIIFT
jgi:2-polyprenyl-3-methyl-5-hydroxy-6-metoxy-1,4-benzoquinol methylase